jgi:type IV secretory pathway VirB4 component
MDVADVKEEVEEVKFVQTKAFFGGEEDEDKKEPKKSKANSADADTLTEEAYEERVTKQVTKYVFEQLRLKRDRNILTKKQCKKYEEKIVRTVIDLAKSDPSAKLDPLVAFMTSQRKEKIKSLCNKYAVVGSKENETKKNNKKE